MTINELAMARAKEIALRKEEILEAFIAKYGYAPDEMVICEQPSTGKFWVEKKSKWISVKDKLPMLDSYGMEPGEGISNPVLIFYTCKDDDTKMKYRRVGFCISTEKGRIEWALAELLTWDCLPKDSDKLLIVTHWMPLPDPPND